jgi:iron complex transport system substrate-binding protein
LTFDYPDSLTEVADLIAPPPAPPPEGDEIPAATTPHRLSLAQVFPQSNARQLRENLLTRMQALRRLTQTASANTPHAQLPRVLLLIGTHPLMASGPHTVLDDMLHYAGGRNAVADATVGAPTLSQERLIGIDPDVILLFDPRGQPLRGVADDPRLAELRGLPLRAVQNQRIHLIDDPLAVLPGTSLTRVAAAMAKLIHPELAPDIERTMSIAPPPPASSTSTPAMSSKPSS